MALSVATAISEILRVINNRNRQAEALLWLQETLREISGYGRWKYLLCDVVTAFDRALPLPPDFDEVCDPVLVNYSGSGIGVNFLKTSDTKPTITGTCPDGTTSITVTVGGESYSAIVNGTKWSCAVTSDLPIGTHTVTAVSNAGAVEYSRDQLVIDPTVTTPVSSVWAPQKEPVDLSQIYELRAQRGDYRVEDGFLVIASQWSSGLVKMQYYRKTRIPASATDGTVDLPDEFAYRIAVYGAAKHGLLGEDDYERLATAQTIYQSALMDMVQKDARRKISGAGHILGQPAPCLYDVPTIKP